MKTDVIYQPTKGLVDRDLSYCPGCTHGIIHKLVAEVLVEKGLLPSSIGVASVGCSVMSYEFFNCDMHQAAHGRAPAVATGIKRVKPEATVFTYQGDGDLASIGLAEIVHAAHRGENITVIFVNNAIYGMTGGQMAPTTLIGQKTTTSPRGRELSEAGEPLRMSELLATIPGATYLERVSVHDPKHIRKAKKAIEKAFDVQTKRQGFSMIEFISTCPVNWGMTPNDSLKWAVDNLIPYYPLGVYKDATKEDKDEA
jgi:2-oxoglutarate ferredoxin oxidoreductase subunit beta